MCFGVKVWVCIVRWNTSMEILSLNTVAIVSRLLKALNQLCWLLKSVFYRVLSIQIRFRRSGTLQGPSHPVLRGWGQRLQVRVRVLWNRRVWRGRILVWEEWVHLFVALVIQLRLFLSGWGVGRLPVVFVGLFWLGFIQACFGLCRRCRFFWELWPLF